MKNRFTLFLLLAICISGFGQSGHCTQYIREPYKLQLAPGTVLPSLKNKISNVHSRSLSCDTFALDYGGYNQVFAQQKDFQFMGASPTLSGLTLTSFADVNHAGDFTYIETLFDTLAYVDVNNNYGFFPLADNTITIDSLGFFIAISGSEPKMLNDSLVISVYDLFDYGFGFLTQSVNNYVYQGYGELLPFIQAPGSVTFAKIGIGQQIIQGDAFAISISYMDKDTSTHCSFTYSYADSCITIPLTVNGRLENLLSPAYLSPLGAISYYGGIQSDGTVQGEDNGSYYTGVPDVPMSCLYVYQQNLGIYPFIHICTADNPVAPTVVTGTDSAITSTTAIIKGTVNANEFTASATFDWGLTTNYDSIAPADYTYISGNTTIPVMANLTGLTPNTTYHYRLESTNDAGTVDGFDSTFTTLSIPLSVSIQKTDVSCFGESNGTAIAVVTGGDGAGTYTYHWSNSHSTDTITGLPAAPYSVTVTSNTQTASASINISQPSAALGATPVITDVACFGDQTGSISLTGTGGTGPYGYNWGNNGGTSSTLGSVGQGSYLVTVTDSKQCSFTASYTVNQPTSALDVSATSTGSSGSNGTGTATASGGSSPYNYTWNSSPEQFGANASGLAPGNYTVTASDSKSCTASAAVSVASISGIIETGNDISSVSLFPNPANEMIQVIVETQGVHEVQMNITDITGKLIYASNENASGRLQKEIALDKFSGGVYILEVSAGNGEALRKKFVVAK